VSVEGWLAIVLALASAVGILLMLQLRTIQKSIDTIFDRLTNLGCNVHGERLVKIEGKVEDHERRIITLEEITK